MSSVLHEVTETARRGEPCARLEATVPAGVLVCVRTSAPGDRVADIVALQSLFESLRRESARPAMRALGHDAGFRLEDTRAIALRVPPDVAAEPLHRWLARRLERDTPVAIVRAPGPLALAASIAGRQGYAPERTEYRTDADGRVRVEAFEVHVAEHCNLRCANCCNMSPFVERRFLEVEEIEEICARMRTGLSAAVVKIMGGEPLLHPRIADVIRALRASGVGDRVRLFTNGLRLRAMSDDFWDALDEMTISNYDSAPVRAPLLDLARQRSREHGFVLNIKDVHEFSQVLSPRFVADPSRTFAQCWLRHRCLIVRRGRFYMCTRAAYAPDFLAAVEHDPVPAGIEIVRDDDGVEIAAPDLAERLLRYLNRDRPLGACHYCRGGDGPVLPHHQLTRGDVAAGRMSRPPEAT
jgi:hypothetical protein